MPIGDWQFWVVTAIAVAGFWLLVKPFLELRGKGKKGAGKGRGTRTKLTISAGKDAGDSDATE
ncbi:MAG: hypothetical protein V2J24_05840 [Pseudomonadales bacterium]|jgi:hypothetical protein|nr:hypothetical protein [Pseudomonadales bacterium]